MEQSAGRARVIIGGRENLKAIDFLRGFNQAVYQENPDVQTVADESTAWPMVSRPTYIGDLGFGLEWHLLQYPPHSGLQRWVSDLNYLYRSQPALYQVNFDQAGFEWIDCNDVERSVVSLMRKGRSPDSLIIVVCNFTPFTHFNYRMGVPQSGLWKELLNSDAKENGGSDQVALGGIEAAPIPLHGPAYSLTFILPPLAAVFFKHTEENP